MRFSSFRIPLFLSLISLALFLAFAAWQSMHIAPEDQEEYNKVAQEHLKKHMARKTGEIKKTSKQIRHNVIKRLYLSEKPPRLNIELTGSRSEVNITTRKAESRFVETFYDVQGIMQEELYYKLADGKEVVFGDKGELKMRGEDVPFEGVKENLQPMQRFRYFEAESAIYDYRTQTLVAQNANFWTYVANGHELIKDRSKLWPESSGSCTSMTVCHQGGLGEKGDEKGKGMSSLKFAAENLKMQITPEW